VKVPILWPGFTRNKQHKSNQIAELWP